MRAFAGSSPLTAVSGGMKADPVYSFSPCATEGGVAVDVARCDGECDIIWMVTSFGWFKIIFYKVLTAILASVGYFC